MGIEPRCQKASSGIFHHETDKKKKKSQAHSNSFILAYFEYASWETGSIQKPGDSPRMLTSTLQGFMGTEGEKKTNKKNI